MAKLDMLFDPSQYGFDLNNREIATFIYLALIVGSLFLWKAGHSRAIAVIRAFFAPRLVSIWAAMTLYVVACTCLLAWLDLWDWPNLKSTLLWWVTVGFTSLFEASRLKERTDSFRKLATETFTISAALIFVVELVSFSLWVELLILPALVFLTLLIAFVERRPEHFATLKLLRSLQTLVGLLILGTSLTLVIEDADKFWSLNTLREFCLPFFLWLLFIPFIFLLAILMSYEEAFIPLKINPQNALIVDYARWRATLAFGFDINSVRSFSRHLREWGIGDKIGVQDSIREIKTLRKRQKKPPVVDATEGWSPYEARLFLQEYGIVTSSYHHSPWGWWADAPAVKLSDRTSADTVSYTLRGNELTVTQLHLSLDAWKEGANREAQLAFDTRALTLLSKVLNGPQPEDVLAHAKLASPETMKVDGIQISYQRLEWGEDHIGRYCRELTIQHSMHIGGN